ncbi:ABC transporter permease [Alteromonadaceae bacterium M269]|nr:ABC transporter permease [Alteromonadaceae bacterium M269]
MTLDYFKVQIIASTKFWLTSKSSLALILLNLLIALGVALLCVNFVVGESTYESWNSKKDTTYRLNWARFENTPPERANIGVTSPALQPELERIIGKNNFLYGAIQSDSPNVSLIIDNTEIKDIQPRAVSPQVPEMFDLRFIRSSGQKISEPGTVIISKSTEERFFNSRDSIGEVLSIKIGDGVSDFTIIGVFDELPNNTHLNFKILFSIENYRLAYPRVFDNLYTANLFSTYITISKGKSVEVITSELRDGFRQRNGGQGDITYELQPISDIHLNPSIVGEYKEPGSKYVNYTAMFVLALLILVTVTNHLNIYLSVLAKRRASLSVNELTGQTRSNQFLFFFYENILFFMIGGILGQSIAFLFVSSSNFIDISVVDIFSMSNVVILAAFVIVLSTISTLAFIWLTSNEMLLERITDINNNGTSLKTKISYPVLVFQVSVFVLVIALAHGAWRNIEKERSKDLGFAVGGYVTEQLNYKTINKNFERIKQSLIASSPSAAVTIAEQTLTDEFNMTGQNIRRPGIDFRLQQAPIIGSGSNIIEALGLKLLAGSDFSDSRPATLWRWTQDGATSGVIVNEGFIKSLGYKTPDTAIGQSITFMWFNSAVSATISGVVNDFEFKRGTTPSTPIMFAHGFFFQGTARIIFNDSGQRDYKDKLRNTVEDALSAAPVHVNTMKQLIDLQYDSEVRAFYFLLSLIIIISITLAISTYFILSLQVENKVKDFAIKMICGCNRRTIFANVSRQPILVFAFSLITILLFFALSKISDAAIVFEYTSFSGLLIGYIFYLIISIITIAIVSNRVNNINPISVIKYK